MKNQKDKARGGTYYEEESDYEEEAVLTWNYIMK